MLKKTILLLAVFFLPFWSFPSLFAQEGSCTRPKVAVKLANFYNDAYEVLRRQYPNQTKEYWIGEIQKEMINKLKANSPGVDIFPAGSGADPEYIISYNVGVISCGEEEKIGYLVSGKDVCYRISGVLESEDACNIEGKEFRHSESIYKDIYTAIALFAQRMGDIGPIISEHERTRPVPPRGPRMKISVDPKSVSPLEGERELNLKAQVTNCKGQPVYDPKRGRYGVIAVPKETGRGETKVVQELYSEPYGDGWKISPDEQGIAGLKYTLKKGINAGKEKIKFTACGLGTKVEDSGEVNIDGLEIKVQAQKTQLISGESTQIKIEFSKIDNKNGKKPVAGKVVEIKVEGLNDGKVSPQGNVTTDANGIATLTYRAGLQDKKVKFTAKYQPKGFKESVSGQAMVNVGNYEAALTITSSSEERYRYDYARGGQNIRHADDEVISVSVRLPLAFDYSLDVPNAGQRWEYYHALSRDISNFSAFSNSERFNRSDYGDIGAETTHRVHMTASDTKFDSPLFNNVVILVFDKKTNKAVKATIPLYGISYTWHVEDMLRTVQWSPKSGRRAENKENPRKENVNYYMKPVEDPIPDPTVNPGGLKDYVDELFRQRGMTPPADIPVKTKKKESKIHPDFLIKSGDGVTTFGGEGKKTKFTPGPSGSTRREEKIFRWELTRTKKEGR